MKSMYILNIIRAACTALLLPASSFSLCLDIDQTGWNASAALLCWHPYQQGLAYTNKPADILTTDDFTLNRAFNPRFQWGWGFRLGVEYTDCLQPWTIQGYWTSVTSKASGKKSFNSDAPDFEGSFPIWSMGPNTLSSDYISTASTNWHLHTNIADLNVQYDELCLCDQLAIQPFAGLRGAALAQNMRVKYGGGIFPSGEDVNTLKSHYYGLGPRLGFNAEYCLDGGFSLFGRAAIAPLFGVCRLKQREVYLDNVLFHRSRTCHPFMLSTDYAIGIRWKGMLLGCMPCMLFDLAWEGQEFFFSNKLYRGSFHFFAKDRSLFLNGITISAALDF